MDVYRQSETDITDRRKRRQGESEMLSEHPNNVPHVTGLTELPNDFERRLKTAVEWAREGDKPDTTLETLAQNVGIGTAKTLWNWRQDSPEKLAAKIPEMASELGVNAGFLAGLSDTLVAGPTPEQFFELRVAVAVALQQAQEAVAAIGRIPL